MLEVAVFLSGMRDEKEHFVSADGGCVTFLDSENMTVTWEK